MKYKDGFECDKKAKNILKDLIENNWFSSCTVYFDEENENYEYASVDVVFTAITKANVEHKYAIELKERKGYDHTDYEDWMIEPHKVKELEKYSNFGYKPMYFNLYKDGYYYLWDYDTIVSAGTETFKYIKPHTQGPDSEGKRKVKRILISSENATLSGQTDSY